MATIVASMPPPSSSFPRAGDYEPCGRTKEDLLAYIRGFIRGGMPAIARLKQVLPSIFDYFKVIARDEKAEILIECGLSPYREKSDVTFFFRGTECDDPLRAPSFITYNWEQVRESDYLSPRSKQAFERQEAAENGSAGFSTPDLEISHSAPELGRPAPSDSPSPLPAFSSLPLELGLH
jgi:hypothetical protein